MKNYLKYILFTCILFSTFSCKKFLDLQPIDSPTEGNFYVDEKGLQGGLISCYDAFQANGLYGGNMPTLAEVRGDNVQNNNPGAGGGVTYQIETFSEQPDNTTLSDTWQAAYKVIYRCNIILDRAPAVKMDEAKKKQVIGQAAFLRALSYFNLTRLWGKLPLVIVPQSSEEARQNPRADTTVIYAQIMADLNTAITSLPTSWPDADRGKVTSYAATALLGKVYVYQKQFDKATSLLQPVVTAIYSKSILALVPQPSTFPNDMKTSKDVIFSIRYLSGGVGESVHQNNRYRNQDNGNIITLPQSLFEAGDNRKALVAPTGNGQRPGKFNGPQTNNETSMDMPVIRSAEVLLLYAEALNNSTAFPNAMAFEALNAVRLNAGITPLTLSSTPDKASFLEAVYKERRLELALECDRWFDIVRTGQMQSTFPLVSSFRYLYPVPQTEIENMNEKTGWQNTGY